MSSSSSTPSPPSSPTLKANQVLLRIYFVDDTHKTLSIDPSISGEQLWDLVASKIGINNKDAECFFIWAQSDEIETVETSPPLSPLSTSTLKRIKEKAPTLRRASSLLGGGSKTMKNSKSTSMSTTVALEHASRFQSSFPTLGEAGQFKLVFRSTSVLPLAMETSIVAPEAIHLFYIQAVHHVVAGNYPCDEDIALKLASIQLQVSVGDSKPEHQAHLRESLETYIPAHLISKHKREEWEALVLPQHILLRGSNPANLKKGYLETCQRWLYYGSTFFAAKYIPTTTSFFLQEFEGKVSVGVNGYGFHIIDSKAMKAVSLHYKDIVCWDSTATSFSIQVLANTTTKQNGKTYMFKTNQGELINDLVHDWMVEWELDAKKPHVK
eukprot:gene15918-18922_t